MAMMSFKTGKYDVGEDHKPSALFTVAVTQNVSKNDGVYAQILINGESACLDEDMTAQLIQVLLGEK